MKQAFLLLSPDANRKSAILHWPTAGVRRATDVEHVECSADPLEVEGARLSSKSSPLDYWSRRTGTVDDCRDWQHPAGLGGLVCISDQTGLTCSLQREELAQDVQELSMSSAR